MSVSQLVQFYAPLVGLLGMAFWTGMLSQRVRTLERDVAEARKGASELRETHDRIIRIETLMEGVIDDVAKMARQIESLQRQMGNLMQTGGVKEFPPIALPDR